MVNNIEDNVIMNGSEESPGSPHSGGEVLAATAQKVADVTVAMVAIEAQIKDIMEQCEILSQNSEDSDSDKFVENGKKGSPKASLPLVRSSGTEPVTTDLPPVTVQEAGRLPLNMVWSDPRNIMGKTNTVSDTTNVSGGLGGQDNSRPRIQHLADNRHQRLQDNQAPFFQWEDMNNTEQARRTQKDT